MGSCGEKNILGEVNLPQFSSAAVPKEKELYAATTSLESSKDFVMHVGGSVWALDWCPRVHNKPDCHTKCEFIAVAAHPPESYYHGLGSPLTGRGIIQIWCMLNVSVYGEEAPPTKKNVKRKVKNNEVSDNKSKKPRGRPRKKPIEEALDDVATKDTSTQVKRPRGRPRKKPRDESTENWDDSDQFVQPLAVQHPEDSFELLTIQEIFESSQQGNVQKNLDREKQTSTKRASSSNSSLKTPVQSRRLKNKAILEKYNDDKCQPLLMPNEDEVAPIANHEICHGSDQDSVLCSTISGNGTSNTSLASCSIPKDLALPRVVLCLAHNGKVAWDVKWKPYNANDSKCKHRMGYLAVLLGNGSLEVWEVPLLSTVKAIYLSSTKDGTDPRFIKLEPVFRCSMLKSGGIQSIPLTLEWSTSPPHDYLLAGCHDGTVALWKFAASCPSKDTRPLLCFSADTVAIRAVSWAPSESDSESANVIVTAGHGGLKFWDIRDPFRPLWDLHPAPRFIYGLDWLPNPRCVIFSFDDGAMRILSLVKAAYDVPATGIPFGGTKQQGLHLVNCSSFAIWSVQVSRLTGMVAYCSADGTVLCFQLTTKAVEKDYSRNRPPHFPCGSLTEDESVITVNTPLQATPITMKKPVSEGERSMRSLLAESTPAKSSNDKKGKKTFSLDNQPLALCYNNDPGEEADADEALEAIKNKREPKFGSSSKKKAKDNQSVVCVDEETLNLQEKGNEKDEANVLPSKLVAIHKVRWNMNKGSERWLCYGGAAGIVRCQEMKKV
ncbi:General transcription factor 3C polypeptide 2 [Melia azedarach]|nr:General transcription factor 3C polypeptide 2 [Melia azedarach]